MTQQYKQQIMAFRLKHMFCLPLGLMLTINSITQPSHFTAVSRPLPDVVCNNFHSLKSDLPILGDVDAKKL